MKVLAIIFGCILILPGLCCVGFGMMFTFAGGGEMSQLGMIELALGVVVTAAAVGLFSFAGRKKQPPR
jgi:hypothetical protein